MIFSIWGGTIPSFSDLQTGYHICINSLTRGYRNDNLIHLTSDPRYFSRIDPNLIDSETRTQTLFLCKDASDCDTVKLFKSVQLYNILGRDGWSTDRVKGFYHGCSSVYVAIQLAASLGASKIIVHGTKYAYGRNILRPSGLVDLPDPLITATQSNIYRAAMRLQEMGKTIEMRGSIL